MNDSGEKKHFSTFWALARWPYMVVVLTGAIIFFVFGLACSVGYTGTTAVKVLKSTDPADEQKWNEFLTLFAQNDFGLDSSITKGKTPYLTTTIDDLEAKNNGQIITFDSRLIRSLNYLAKPQNTNKECGWNEVTKNPRHERVKVEVEPKSNNGLSDLSKVSSASTSTLSRGTGARISESGYLRCSWLYQTSDICPDATQWHVYGEYKILLDNKISPLLVSSIPPDKPYSSSLPFQTQCSIKIQCAVDNFPLTSGLVGNDLKELQGKNIVLPFGENNPGNFDSKQISSLNPNIIDIGDPHTMPQTIPGILAKSGQAQLLAAYKTAQIALEILTLDNVGCEQQDGNFENTRNIPTTIIVAKWIADIMEDKDVWKNLLDIAKSKTGFPYNLQIESPLAGLSFDSALDSIAGIHFNY